MKKPKKIICEYGKCKTCRLRRYARQNDCELISGIVNMYIDEYDAFLPDSDELYKLILDVEGFKSNEVSAGYVKHARKFAQAIAERIGKP